MIFKAIGDALFLIATGVVFISRRVQIATYILIDRAARVLASGLRHRWKYLLALQIGNFVFYIVFGASFGFLPSPFVQDKNDTFMDFYHTAFWSADSGRFSIWHSVYPPFVFVLLRSLMYPFPATELAHDGFSLRALWPQAIPIIVASYVVAISAAAALWPGRTIRLTGRVYWAVFFALSPPALFALERGNLVFLLPPLVVLTLRDNKILRAIAEAIMINIKPYMALMLLVYIVKGDFRGFVQSASLNLAVFLLSGLIIDPNFLDFLQSFMTFSQVTYPWQPNALMSMVASPGLLGYAAAYRYEVRDFELSLSPLYVGLSRIPLFVCYAMCLYGIVYAFVRRWTISEEMIRLFIVALVTNCVLSAGGYSLIFYVGCFGCILNGGTEKRLWFVTIIAIFAPIDLIVTHIDHGYDVSSYIGGSQVRVVDFRMAASYLRPALNMFLLGLIVREIARDPTGDLSRRQFRQ
ncbi:MAG: hypothetical protein P4N59_04255 [Negativicutes bacterium]|nr:hypothetical protein [Negativicutes bacterium]